MFKKSKTIKIPYILFCVFTIYILPLIFNFDEIYGKIYEKDHLYAAAECSADMSAWVCGIGGLMLMLGAAVYEFFACQKQGDDKKDTAVWLCFFTVLPLILLGLITIIMGEGSGYNVALLYMPFVFTSGGVWFGRLAAGRYRGIKQFYAADMIYIAVCVILCLLMCAAKETMYLEWLLLFAASVLYGRFSEFERVQERALRAMIVSMLALLPAAVIFCKYIGFRNEIMPTFYSYYSDGYYYGENGFLGVYMNYAGFAAILCFTVFMGVLIGYGLRIMRLGGEKEYGRREQKRTLIKYAAFIIAVLAVTEGVKFRYFFYKQEAVYDILNVNTADIAMVELSFGSSGSAVPINSINGECIEKVVDILKTEKGAMVKSLPYEGEAEKCCLSAYDETGKELFYVYSDRKGELFANGYNFVIPTQYYGLTESKAKSYQNAIKNAQKPTDEERLQFIKQLDEMSSWYYHSFDRLLAEWSAEGGKQVKLAIAERLGKFDSREYANILIRLALDKDGDIKKEAYSSLARNFGSAGIEERLMLAREETDEIYRFYAVTYLARKNRTGLTSADEDDAFIYIHKKYLDAVTDMDRLTYTCAMIKCGKRGYCDEAEVLAARLPDTEKYAEIKKEAARIIEQGRKG